MYNMYIYYAKQTLCPLVYPPPPSVHLHSDYNPSQGLQCGISHTCYTNVQKVSDL